MEPTSVYVRTQQKQASPIAEIPSTVPTYLRVSENRPDEGAGRNTGGSTTLPRGLAFS